jgi:hypothetical protein
MPHLRADLDDRLVHLGLDLIAEDRWTRCEELRNVGAEVTRGGIDDLKLFLDAGREGVIHGPGPRPYDRPLDRFVLNVGRNGGGNRLFPVAQPCRV